MEQALQYFSIAWIDPYLMGLVALGTFAGIYIGAIPGLSVTMAVSILISFTFSWEVDDALCLMVGIFMGGVYGGSRTAILLNIPGAPSAIATAMDGYPLAQRGEAGQAIGLSTVMSVIGGFIGIFALAVAAPFISEFALKFQPRDYMLLGVLGILLVGSLSGESLAKGVLAGALGMLIGVVGLDPLTAEERFTFGMVDLWGGISFVAVMIGLFGVSEALAQLHYMDKAAVKQIVTDIIPSRKAIMKYMPLSLQTSTIGVIIGALPGTGGDIAALLAYDHAKRVTKNPEVPFGEGAKEGLVAPETANNAAVGGAFIPMLTLGIPGDAVTAIFIGALFIHGLNPGPMLMVDRPEMFWFMVGNLTLSNIFLLIFGLTGIKIFTKIVECPRGILIPLILLLSVVGAYAVNNSVTDVYWMLGFGVLGYFMKIYSYQIGPVILGVILSRLIDENWRRAIISEQESLGAFFANMVSSPLSLVLLLVVAFIFLSQTPLGPVIRKVLLGGKTEMRPLDLQLGLIGDNIKRSKSPRLHRLAGDLNEMHVSYLQLIPKELGKNFGEVFADCTTKGYRGINVTYPYKEVAAVKVTIDDPLVRAIGAVNTVVFREDGPVGFNTDYTGFKAAYRNVMGDQNPGVVCMIGGGGVGKAVAFGLLDLGMRELRIVERDVSKAHKLAGSLRAANPELTVVVTEDAAEGAAGATGVVNCTPVGMVGYEGTPLPRKLMAGAKWAFDAVYTPVDTQFLKDAEAEGLKIISGYELFFYQGLHAWEIFSGKPVAEAALREALLKPEAEDAV